MSDVYFEEDPVEQPCISRESSGNSSGIKNIIVSIIGLAAFMRGRELSTLVVITLAAVGE